MTSAVGPHRNTPTMTDTPRRSRPPSEHWSWKPNPYVLRQNSLAAAWKCRTKTLPEPARAAGKYGSKQHAYPHCLPAEFAKYNLLPDVRDGSVALFDELNIPWHDGVPSGGPSNNLRDSQVQCVNALFRMTKDPNRAVRAFSNALEISKVLPIEDGRFLAFEYIGPQDYFGEGVHHGKQRERQRGKNCTSVDAAMLYVTPSGTRELALIEWKYTESYQVPAERKPASDAIRKHRYQPDLGADDSPVADDVLPIELLLDEPFFQLMRQQLLAHRLEVDRVLGADTVRVLHVLSPENTAYQESLVRPEHRAAGDSVDEVWGNLLRTPNRFVHLDPAVFLDPLVTSAEYVDRYDPGGQQTSVPSAGLVRQWRTPLGTTMSSSLSPNDQQAAE